MKKSMKRISLVLFGSLAWVLCMTVQPGDKMRNDEGGVSILASSFIPQVFADEDSDKSANDENKSEDKSVDDEDKSDDKSSDDEDKSEDKSTDSEETSSTSTTLVCVNQTLVASALSSSTESEDDDKSADTESEDDDKSADTEDDDNSSGNKVTLCHVPPGNPDNPQTLSVSSNAVDAHLSQHAGDHLGACTDSEASDTESEDDNKSADTEDEGDDKSADTESTDTTVSNLSTCTAIDSSGSASGYWVPDSAVNDDGTVDGTALTTYLATAPTSGGAGGSTPDSSMKAYRDIRGQ